MGPLARYSLNFDKLTPLAQEAAKEAGLGPVCTNPFKSIIVRCVETLYAVEEALRILENYEDPEQPAVDFEVKAGIGSGGSEAPRGTLYHRYTIDENGIILDAHIMPPTAQNQKTIESDLRAYRRPARQPAGQRTALAMRAGHPQLRSVHLVLDAFFAGEDRKDVAAKTRRRKGGAKERQAIGDWVLCASLASLRLCGHCFRCLKVHGQDAFDRDWQCLARR